MDRFDIDITPEPEAVALLPEAIARTLRCIPLAAGPRTLKLAVATPLTGEQLRSLTGITERQLICQIEPGPHIVDVLIEEAYGDDAQVDSNSDSDAGDSASAA
jgi:hypothetical protein